jgi:hypothetical protein
MPRWYGRIALAAALLGFAALRVEITGRTAFNWDEFALFHDVAVTAQSGELQSADTRAAAGGAAPLVRDCADEIRWVGARLAGCAHLGLPGRRVRAARQLLPAIATASRRRASRHCSVLRPGSSVVDQVRTDQVARSAEAGAAALDGRGAQLACRGRVRRDGSAPRARLRRRARGCSLRATCGHGDWLPPPARARRRA